MKTDKSIIDALSPGEGSEIPECPECFRFAVGGLRETHYSFLGYPSESRFVCGQCWETLEHRHFERELEKQQSESFQKWFQEAPVRKDQNLDFPFILIPVGVLVVLLAVIMILSFL